MKSNLFLLIGWIWIVAVLAILVMVAIVVWPILRRKLLKMAGRQIIKGIKEM